MEQSYYFYEDDDLMVASFGGHTEIVLLLLDRGADVNMKNNHGKTVLMLASL